MYLLETTLSALNLMSSTKVLFLPSPDRVAVPTLIGATAYIYKLKKIKDLFKYQKFYWIQTETINQIRKEQKWDDQLFIWAIN